ncbi:MAG: hypothetical protein WAN65_07505 [Candidatus Sulfotelmatobacter sp.]
MKGIRSMRASFELRFLLLWVAVLVAVVPPAAGQLPDQEKAGAAASGSAKYQISATVTDYCPVEKTVTLHFLLFDFHNNSCQNPRRVSDLRTPTLPYGPLYRDVRISGYHFADWKEGQPSPNARNEVRMEISKAASTLTASGTLGKASCGKSATGKSIVEETIWQASIVPEVTLLEYERRQQEVAAEIVPPQTTAVLNFSAGCDSDHPQSLEYTVTPIGNGVAQASIYTGELQADKRANESGDSAASIHALWSSLPAKGESELSVSVVDRKSGMEPANSPAP